MTKFNRVANLDIRLTSGKPNFAFTGESLIVKNLRIIFQITKSLSWSTNQASIQIYNLSFEKRNKLKDYGDELTIFAGYSEDSGSQLLFIGDTTRVSHLFEQPEIISSIECGDGERIINQIITSVSFGTNVSARTIIETVASNVGLDIGYFAPTDNLVYKNGFQFTGMVKDAIAKVAKYLKLTQSIQNKKLYLVPEEGSTEKPPVTISQNTGMVGVPQRYTYKRLDLWIGGPRQGYKVKTLLRPDILPGDKVRMISEKINVDELFYVDTVKHSGDTYGQSWYSDWELVAL